MNKYFEKKNQFKKDALRHHEIVIRNYPTQVQHSIEHTIEYKKDFKLNQIDPRFDYTGIYFLNCGTSEAILGNVQELFDEEKESICALNFASYKNPGGMFMNGSSAQEECLCHESILYEVLSYFENTYYKENRKNLNNALYENHLLYSKYVLFFNDNYNAICDIITCAAPNRSAAKKYRGIEDDKIIPILISRIFFVLQAAYDQKVDNLILGSYGTGVFGNDVRYVASIFKVLTKHIFRNCFKRIIYAIPTLSEKDKTYETFRIIINNEYDIERDMKYQIKNMYSEYWRE